MTAAEWRACDYPAAMLEAVGGRGRDRAYFLLALHTCRGLLDDQPVPALRTALTICERHVEGRSSPFEVSRLLSVICSRIDSFGPRPGTEPDWRAKRRVMMGMLELISATADQAFGGDTRWPSRAQHIASPDADPGQAHVIRCVFGDPFRPVAFHPAWRTETAVAIAQGMYEARDFAAMPILADALQDAGCEDAAVLSHCRAANGVHVRGCWVVDGVLSRK